MTARIFAPGVRDDVADVVAVVDQRLHDQRALPRDLGAAQAADQLLALAAEHRAADDLEPAAGVGLRPDHAAGHYWGRQTYTSDSALDEAEPPVQPVRGLAMGVASSARRTPRRPPRRARSASSTSASPTPRPRADSSTTTSWIQPREPGRDAVEEQRQRPDDRRRRRGRRAGLSPAPTRSRRARRASAPCAAGRELRQRAGERRDAARRSPR